MNGLSSQSGLKDFLVELLQRKTIAGFVAIVIARYIGYYPPALPVTEYYWHNLPAYF